MTINTEDRKAGPYNTNGVTTVFPFDFKVFNSTQLLVVKALISTGVETILALTTDYTVSLNANQDVSPGGSITTVVAGIATPIATGSTITITSDVQATQEVTITNPGGFLPETFNDIHDKLTILIQQVALTLARTLKFTLSSDVGDITLDPPVPLRGLKWNSGGTGITNTASDPDTILPQAQTAATNAAASATAAAASQTAAASSASAASSSQTAAASSASAASSSQTAAASSASAAATSATNSENSALSVGSRLTGTSVTSNTIGTGTKTWTTQTAKGFAVGMYVIASRTSDITQFMTGQVSAYNSGTGSISIDIVTGNTNGSGTYTDWTFAVSGLRGQSGVSSGQILSRVTDTTLGYLNDKLVVAGSLVKAILNSGGNEQIQITGNIKVKQIVTATIAGDSAYATSSTTYNDTGLTANITPQNSGNKILIFWSGGTNYVTNGTPGTGKLRVLRGASSIEGAAGTKELVVGGSNLPNQEINTVVSRMIVDAPATTSALTYKVQGKTGNAAHTLKIGEYSDAFLVLVEFEP